MPHEFIIGALLIIALLIIIAVIIKKASASPSSSEGNTDSFSPSSGTDSEIVAAIAAAIHAIGEAEGKTYRITGIRKKERPLRSSWGVAGIYESMKRLNG